MWAKLSFKWRHCSHGHFICSTLSSTTKCSAKANVKHEEFGWLLVYVRIDVLPCQWRLYMHALNDSGILLPLHLETAQEQLTQQPSVLKQLKHYNHVMQHNYLQLVCNVWQSTVSTGPKTDSWSSSFTGYQQHVETSGQYFNLAWCVITINVITITII